MLLFRPNPSGPYMCGGWYKSHRKILKNNSSSVDVCQMLRIFFLLCVFQLNFTIISLIFFRQENSFSFWYSKQCAINVIRGERFMFVFFSWSYSQLLFNSHWRESHKGFLKPFFHFSGSRTRIQFDFKKKNKKLLLNFIGLREI